MTAIVARQAAAWSWSDVDWSESAPAPVPAFQHGGTKRAQGGSLSRFVGTGAHARRAEAALRADHPAVVDGRTLFPTRVFHPDDAPRLLVSGHNSAKIGAVVRKGAWRGYPIYTLTLEERATCPSSCSLWRECYGNAMPLARRHAHGPALIARLGEELAAKARQHPGGFAIRLHVLGDFWSLEYLAAWFGWMDDIPALHVWGYTAHPMGSLIGRGIDAGNDLWPDRWALRFSVAPDDEGDRGYTATTVWRQPATAVVAEGQVCPAQMHRTAACATCGLCWSKAAAGKRIVFIGHGMRRAGGGAMTHYEYLTAEQVLDACDVYCATKGNPALASVMRDAFERDGKIPRAALVSLGLEPATLYRRALAPEAVPPERQAAAAVNAASTRIDRLRACLRGFRRAMAQVRREYLTIKQVLDECDAHFVRIGCTPFSPDLRHYYEIMNFVPPIFLVRIKVERCATRVAGAPMYWRKVESVRRPRLLWKILRARGEEP